MNRKKLNRQGAIASSVVGVIASLSTWTSAGAQAVNSTLIQTYQSVTDISVYDWNTPSNWTGGQAPGGGGTATFTPSYSTGARIGLGGNNFVYLNSTANPTLSRMDLQGFGIWQFSGSTNSGSGTIVTPTEGMTLSADGPIPLRVSLGTTGGGASVNWHFMNLPIVGTGPVIKTGTGWVGFVNRSNTFNGLVLREGMAVLQSFDSGTNDAMLGQGSVTIDGGSIAFTGSGVLPQSVGGTRTGGVQISRNFNVTDKGGALFSITGNAGFTGNITGSGPLTIDQYTSGGSITFNTAMSYGGTITLTGSSFLQLNNNGTILNVPKIVGSGTLFLQNVGNTTGLLRNSNRLSDTLELVSGSMNLQTQGNGAPSVVETFGSLTLDSGTTAISLSITGTTAYELGFNMQSITRLNRSVLQITGARLGGVAAVNNTSNTVVSITNGVSGSLIGGGGAAGTTTRSIIPWAVNTTAPFSLISWDSSNNRLAALPTNDYASSLASSVNATDNVRLTASETVPTGGKTVNSLVLFNNTSNVLTLTGSASNPLTITSGTILFSTQVATNARAQINASLDFGSQEAIIHGFNTISFGGSAKITGTNGLTKAGGGPLFFESGFTSGFSGPVTIQGGVVTVGGNLPVNADSALGNSNTPITIVSSAGGGTAGNLSALYMTTTSVIDRNINVTGIGPGVTAIGNFLTPSNVTYNGNISTSRDLRLDFNVLGTATFNGVISGTGRLTDNNTSSGAVTVVVLNNANTLTGGFAISAGRYIANNDLAFGPAPIAFNGGSITPIIQSGGTGAFRTIANTFNIFFGTVGLRSPIGAPQLVLTGAIDLRGNPSGFYTDGIGNNPVIISGPISNGRFTFNNPVIGGDGLGRIILTSNANSYLAGTQVLAGYLQVGDGGTSGILGPGPVDINVTGSFLGAVDFYRSDNQTIANTIRSDNLGLLRQLGPSTLTLTGDLTGFKGDMYADGLVYNTSGGSLVVKSPLRPVTGGFVASGSGTSAVLDASASASAYTVAGEFSFVYANNISTLKVSSTNRAAGLKPKVLITNAGPIGFSYFGPDGSSSDGPLSVTGSGLIDLTNNDMIVRAGSNISADTVRSLVSSWWNGGAKNGSGLGSSVAAAEAYTTLAVFPNSTYDNQPYFLSYDGVSLTAGDTIVKYTYLGDTNLDGVLDGQDYKNVYEGFLLGQSGWLYGDVDNSGGPVTQSDLDLFLSVYSAVAFNPSYSSLGNGSQILYSEAVVPEPSSVTVLAGALPLLSGRRRRGRSCRVDPVRRGRA